MKTRLVGLTALVTALVVGGSSAAMAWHVDTGSYEQTVTDPQVKLTTIGPKGDPFYRIIVKVKPARFGACQGYVEVPDAKWAQGTTLTVDGTNVAIGRGERATLPAGSYVGRWSNSKEIERFKVTCDRAFVPAVLQSYTVKWHGKGKTKRYTQQWTLREDCTLKSRWRFLEGRTMSRVVVKDASGTIVKDKRFRAAKPGFYGRLYRGFTPGVSCS